MLTHFCVCFICQFLKEVCRFYNVSLQPRQFLLYWYQLHMSLELSEKWNFLPLFSDPVDPSKSFASVYLSDICLTTSASFWSVFAQYIHSSPTCILFTFVSFTQHRGQFYILLQCDNLCRSTGEFSQVLFIVTTEKLAAKIKGPF